MKDQSQPSSEKSLGSALRTGILVAAAFFAGLGVANLSAINGLAPAQLPIPQESEGPQPETTATARIYDRSGNRPPSNVIRDWYVNKDLNGQNGKTYKTIEHYHIQEVAFLVATYVYDKGSNELFQKDTLYDYRYYPDIKESYMADGKLAASRRFNNFSEKYFVPESAQFKTLLNDGSWDVEDVEYKISTKFTNIKPQQPAKQKNNTDDLLNEFKDIFEVYPW